MGNEISGVTGELAANCKYISFIDLSSLFNGIFFRILKFHLNKTSRQRGDQAPGQTLQEAGHRRLRLPLQGRIPANPRPAAESARAASHRPVRLGRQRRGRL